MYVPVHACGVQAYVCKHGKHACAPCTLPPCLGRHAPLPPPPLPTFHAYLMRACVHTRTHTHTHARGHTCKHVPVLGMHTHVTHTCKDTKALAHLPGMPSHLQTSTPLLTLQRAPMARSVSSLLGTVGGLWPLVSHNPAALLLVCVWDQAKSCWQLLQTLALSSSYVSAYVLPRLVCLRC